MNVSFVLPILLLGAASGSWSESWSASWTAIDNGLPSAAFGVSRLTIDPTTPTTLYSLTNSGSIFKSTDAAASWKPVNGVVGVNLLAADPQNSGTIYAATGHGIVKSVNGGETWAADIGLSAWNVTSLDIDPVTPTTLYALAGGGI